MRWKVTRGLFPSSDAPATHALNFSRQLTKPLRSSWYNTARRVLKAIAFTFDTCEMSGEIAGEFS